VINLNAFIARHPEKVRLTYKTSVLTGLWQLDLTDLENEENLWTVGHYVDGLEDRFAYDITARRSYRHYEGLDGEYVLWMAGGFIFVALPHKGRQEVVLVAPQVCNRTDPLREPIYIWRSSAGLNVLDCGGGLETFAQKKQFEEWVRSRTEQIIRWQEWFVIPGVIRGNEEWLTAVARAVHGLAYPTPEEVFALVDELLYP
jgi:hypothetical protein